MTCRPSRSPGPVPGVPTTSSPATVLALTLSLASPRLLVEAQCLWASAHLVVRVSDAEPFTDETQMADFASGLASLYSMDARLEGPWVVNGTTTATIHLAGPAEWGYDPHSARLNFLKPAGNTTGQVDILVVLLGPDARRVGPDGREAFRQAAEIDGGDLASLLRGPFGAVEIAFRSSQTYTGPC